MNAYKSNTKRCFFRWDKVTLLGKKKKTEMYIHCMSWFLLKYLEKWFKLDKIQVLCLMLNTLLYGFFKQPSIQKSENTKEES